MAPRGSLRPLGVLLVLSGAVSAAVIVGLVSTIGRALSWW